MTPQFTPSAAYVAREQAAFERLIALGVTLGNPVDLTAHEKQVGHTNCEYHLVVTATGDDTDGGSASTILSLLTGGTYGDRKPDEYTLHPTK